MGQLHLQKIGEHTWIYPCDAVKDRSNLGYIRGAKMVLAVDAGHSSSHVMDFRRLEALEQQIRALDARTVIDGHWKPYTKKAFLAEL